MLYWTLQTAKHPVAGCFAVPVLRKKLFSEGAIFFCRYISSIGTENNSTSRRNRNNTLSTAIRAACRSMNAPRIAASSRSQNCCTSSLSFIDIPRFF